MTTKKNLKFRLLAVVLVIISVVNVSGVSVFAAESLTKDNVSKWPTITCPNEDGYFYFGQKIGDIILNDDEVVLDSAGNQVPGHFECITSAKIQLAVGENKKLSVKFIPDSSEYSGFTMLSCPDITYTCKVATPVFKDEENDPIVATEAEVGRALSLSVLSGGAMCNPWDSSKDLSSYSWEWKDPDTIVESAGNYIAVFKAAPSTYGPVEKEVYVSVKAATKTDTEIKEVSVPTLVYDGVSTWGDVQLTGTVVEKGTENVVDGTFSVTNRSATAVVKSGTYENIAVKFTPDDTEKYDGCDTTISLTVNKGTPAWTSGEKLVLEYDYGDDIFVTHGGQLDQVDARNLNCYVAGTNAWNYQFTVYDLDKNPVTLRASDTINVGTYEYLLKVDHPNIDDSWDTENTYLPVQIIVKPGEAEVTSSYNEISNILTVSVSLRYLYGTFDVYIDGKLAFDNVELQQAAMKTKNFEVEWTPAVTSKNSVHTVKLVYNKADKDNAVINDDYEGTFNFKAIRAISVGTKSCSVSIRSGTSYNPDPNKNSSATNKLFAGDKVKIEAGLSDFRYWIIKDANGKEIDLGIDLNSPTATFEMPDYNISIDYVCQFELDKLAMLEDCDCLCHSDNQIAKFFWNIILKIMDIFSRLFGYENVCDCGFAHGTPKN